VWFSVKRLAFRLSFYTYLFFALFKVNFLADATDAADSRRESALIRRISKICGEILFELRAVVFYQNNHLINFQSPYSPVG
jgi:hypothetical protein